MMSSQSLRLPELFQPDLWSRAGWFAVTYLTPRDVSPTLGLVFRDRDVATAIFTGWSHALGQTDADEIVRVALIEPNVSGSSDPSRDGYHVHLGLDWEVVAQRQRDAGGDGAAATSPRKEDVWCRMRGAGAALARFKEAYQRSRRYLLVPGTMDRSGSVELMPHLMIAKHRLVLRRVGDVATVNDPDAGLWSRSC